MFVIAGSIDGNLPDPADQDTAPIARETDVCKREPIEGVPEADSREHELVQQGNNFCGNSETQSQPQIITSPHIRYAF